MVRIFTACWNRQYNERKGARADAAPIDTATNWTHLFTSQTLEALAMHASCHSADSANAAARCLFRPLI